MILNDRSLISFTRNIEFHRTIRYSYIYVIKKYISSKSNTKKLHLSISNIIKFRHRNRIFSTINSICPTNNSHSTIDLTYPQVH